MRQQRLAGSTGNDINGEWEGNPTHLTHHGARDHRAMESAARVRAPMAQRDGIGSREIRTHLAAGCNVAALPAHRGRTNQAVAMWTWSGRVGGTPMLVLPNWGSHLHLDLSASPMAEFLRRLGAGRPLLRLDLPGTGLSPQADDFSMDLCLRLIDAVLDAAGNPKVTVLAWGLTGPLGISFAATRPHRVANLVLAGTGARFCGPSDNGLLDPRLPAILQQLILSDWHIGSRTLANLLLPHAADTLPAELARYLQVVTTPESTALAVPTLLSADVTPLLMEVRCPTLVVGHQDVRFPPAPATRDLIQGLRDPVHRLCARDTNSVLLQDIREVVATITSFLTPDPDPLTSRELVVVQHLAMGLSNRLIARRLGIAESTVARHLANVFRKLGVNNRVAAVTRAGAIGALHAMACSPMR